MQRLIYSDGVAPHPLKEGYRYIRLFFCWQSLLIMRLCYLHNVMLRRVEASFNRVSRLLHGGYYEKSEGGMG